MQFTTLALALGFTSTILGAAVNNLTPGLAIHKEGTPFATSLTVAHVAVDEVEKRDLERRAGGHLYLCTANDFKGSCENVSFTTGVCYDLYSPYQDSISAARPDQGFNCKLFRDYSCAGPSVSITYPGIARLGEVNFNDKASSFRCN